MKNTMDNVCMNSAFLSFGRVVNLQAVQERNALLDEALVHLCYVVKESSSSLEELVKEYRWLVEELLYKTYGDLRRFGYTVVDVAVRYNKDSLKFLVEEFGEKVLEGKDKDGNSVLHLAAEFNQDSLKLIIKTLGEKVLEDRNKLDQSVAQIAVRENIDSLKLLIDTFGEKVLEDKNKDGKTVPHTAAEYNTDSLKLLIDAFGEKILETEDKSGNTVLYYAVMNYDSLKLLIDTFGEKAVEKIDGNVMVHSVHRSSDSLKLLTEVSSENIQSWLEEKEKYGRTTIHLATQYRTDSLQFLIERFPETVKSLLSEKSWCNETVLHVAATFNKDSLKLLIEKFPEIVKSLLSEKNIDGDTALHLAAKNGSFDIFIKEFPEEVKTLRYVKNNKGKTVLQYALIKCPENLPEEFKSSTWDCIVSGDKNCVSIPGLPEAFSSYHQDQVAVLLKLRLEDEKPGILNSIEILEENYIFKESDGDSIAEKLSSFILTSGKSAILIPLNIGGNHLVGIVVEKCGNKVKLHYMDSELNPHPEFLIAKIRAIIESHGYSMELRIAEVEKQKYSNCGSEVVENLTAFATEKPRTSQEEAIVKHSIVLEKHLLKNSDDSFVTF